MKVDSSQHIRNVKNNDVKLGQQLHFAARNGGVEAQLLRSGHKVFLKHLNGHDTCFGTTMFGQQLQRALLFRWRSLVIGIDHYVRVEKTTSAHEFRRD